MDPEIASCVKTPPPDVRRSWRFWRRVAIANLAAAVIVLGFNGVFAEPVLWSKRIFFFGIALIYTTPVSAMLGLGLPSVIPRLSHLRPELQWTGRFIAILLLTAIGLSVGGFVLVAAGWLRPAAYWRQILGSFSLAAVIAVSIATTISIFESLRTRLDETTIALKTKELEEERARKLASEAQLASLESRIHPHFLFNTLNTIAALIQEDPKKAERTVGQLASLLRWSLDASTSGSVPLCQEIRVVRDYLEIESARFGDRLRTEIDIDPEIAEVAIPPLSIQTLVENAVKHGISTRRHGGRIQVRGRRNGTGILIEVADNGEEFATATFPPGHGLDNLRGRLRAAYGDAAAVRLSNGGGWTTAMIEIRS